MRLVTLLSPTPVAFYHVPLCSDPGVSCSFHSRGAPILTTRGGHCSWQSPGEVCELRRIPTACGHLPGSPVCQASSWIPEVCSTTACRALELREECHLLPPYDKRIAAPEFLWHPEGISIPVFPSSDSNSPTELHLPVQGRCQVMFPGCICWNLRYSLSPPRCSQDPVTGQIVNDLLTNRKESIPLQFSEDCLYLNIYTPSDLTRSDRLPVMVWIHGGGLVLGGASTYDGLVLSTHENVVVVVIQYRLGIWGFLSTGDEHSQGNWGHLDQVAALRWVQDNIANFGGDPCSVTIFGESAGGESVSVLVLSPLAKNLFHRAISESGVVLTAGLVKKNTRPLVEKIAVTTGCKNTTSSAMVHCLRQKTEEELLETTLKLNLFKLDLHGDARQSHPFIPTVVDGVLLPKMPEEILAEKNFNTVPYIVGINKQEFGWILPTMMDYPPSDVKLDQKTATSLLKKSSFILNLPEDEIPVAIQKYLGDTEDPGRNKHQLLELIGDVAFGVPSVIVSRGHRDAGAPTYVYEFQYRPSFSPEMKPKTVIGDHGDEVYSVFGAPILRDGASEEEINLSKTVMKFWANFARNGNPNGKGLPHWPEYDQKEGYLQIGATIQQAQRLKDKEVALWTELLAKKPPLTGHTEL